MPGPKSKRKRLQVSNLGNWGVKKRKVVKDTESDKENVCIMIHEGVGIQEVPWSPRFARVVDGRSCKGRYAGGLWNCAFMNVLV